MDVHLGIEHSFEGRFHHSANQTVEVVQRLGLAGELTGELLGLELKGRIHASHSVKKDGQVSYTVCVPDTRFFTGPESL